MRCCARQAADLAARTAPHMEYGCHATEQPSLHTTQPLQAFHTHTDNSSTFSPHGLLRLTGVLLMVPRPLLSWQKASPHHHQQQRIAIIIIIPAAPAPCTRRAAPKALAVFSCTAHSGDGTLDGALDGALDGTAPLLRLRGAAAAGRRGSKG